METEIPSEINVYLCFSGYERDPDEISSLVGLVPSSVHKIGQCQTGRSVLIARSFWSAKLIEGKKDDVGRLIEEAVSNILDRSSAITTISNCTVNESYIGVTVRIGSNKPSINISPDTLREIANMRLSLDIGLFD